MGPTAAPRNAPGTGLGIPLRQTIGQLPFWHREEPLLAVTRLDPEYAELRRHFPETWQYLVRAKTLFDGITALDVPAITGDDPDHFERTSFLLTAASDVLLRFAEAEEAASARAVVQHARAAAERLSIYAHTREWKTATLFEPRPEEPWLYCGPISTWAMRDAGSPVALLVAVPRADLQTEVDEITARIGELRTEAARVLGGEVKSVQKVNPTMQVTDLLLAGGESVSGHKNFAHFFPLEAAGATVLGPEFTVVFANVHRERLGRCSLELLKSVGGTVDETRLDAALRMSLRWFRCHDLGHFWRRASVPAEGEPAEGINHFERMALEEAYADTLGLLTAEAVGADGDLDTAFTAELIRYLSRRYHHFADTSAALLTLGWIRQYAAETDFPARGGFLRQARPALEDLARTLHGVLWDADASELGRLRAALARGTEYLDSISGHFRSLPTDLSYTFG
ncbi:hypothetical protein [Streptomyces macrosporus]|uniref:DUF403 domain-containing protein n=1 Tax=Streptomyces macrosporus TaxID=44032 RepID=A0ABN3JII2_9ACTN